MNKRSRNKILIIIFIIILLIILITVINSQLKTTESVSYERLEYINNDKSWSDSFSFPIEFSSFYYLYNGELGERTIVKSAYYVATEVFPGYYADLKDADDEKIEKYYSKYLESIKINLAIDNQKQFTNLIHELQELSGDELVWQSYRIDVDTIKVGANYTKAVLYITYEGNSEIPINIKVKNKMSNNYSSIVYTVST